MNAKGIFKEDTNLASKKVQLNVVGVDFSDAVVFIEIQFGDSSFLLGYLYHKTALSLIHFPSSRAGRSGLESDSEAVNDVLVVHGFSIGYKLEFHILSTFPMVWAASFWAMVSRVNPAEKWPSMQDFDPIFTTVSDLCEEHQRLAFCEGLRLGVTLMKELAEE